MRTNKSITLTLGKQQQVLDAMVESGDYDSASEAVRAALRALEREREALDEIMRLKVQEAMDDPRPSIPAAKVFAELREFHASQAKADKRGS
ncbi:type II toxin-antitoxin system ParD family antitoxin [Neorhizobium sp. BETTINA12A]|jgi:antitoxin ParD1/3/4|uniref:Type II toxin-antitoxin system ParD family antitoxin n=1 Tax=Neorhizobium galegae TaxID=399 RepID=A0A6A1TK99_NEOGA|nr:MULTISPECIES: type II toxin-antitoxin system ParD family antitoxin [Neorhizobium]KAB1083397.1 type II toxin-antitoxin system ParD family antitoxin [Neorhizobium galegae]MCJ9673717.1 type II toxin-antitoxin system ParD family antitoxin [Neorhizobium sp. SHOUNA12B]MCJ9748713.1 type II toxin-antitoxin system ParD family antitoxin [Neorhizobium sp. SHOUNA12A]MCJ9753802.1 type II toxin-antitoxin system ParD family antitoxin [Neorhizobium sp. BETTINA12A]